VTTTQAGDCPAQVHLSSLDLRDFRNHRRTSLELPPGLTALVGRNGHGKTNLLEAVVWLATGASFRGADPAEMVRSGADRAIVRAGGEAGGRRLLVEAEIPVVGRPRLQVNRQRVQRLRDLPGWLRVTLFTPHDLDVVQRGPDGRRRYLDDLLSATDPRAAAARSAFERALRQRNALLRQLASRAPRNRDDDETTLAVWDDRLAAYGDELGSARAELVERHTPGVRTWYRRLAGTADEVDLTYLSPWRERGLRHHLLERRDEERRRGTTLSGPHRDDLVLRVGGLVARSHASQGEQRTLALALRLAAHDHVTDRAGQAPLVLLDDVFSELDPGRVEALVAALPATQTLLTTASPVMPPGIVAEQVLVVEDGAVRPMAE
jgi:DNA replication and repair protein RecF